MKFIDLELDLKVLKETYNQYIEKYGKASDGLELAIQHLNAEIQKTSKMIAYEVAK